MLSDRETTATAVRVGNQGPIAPPEFVSNIQSDRGIQYITSTVSEPPGRRRTALRHWCQRAGGGLQRELGGGEADASSSTFFAALAGVHAEGGRMNVHLNFGTEYQYFRKWGGCYSHTIFFLTCGDRKNGIKRANHKVTVCIDAIPCCSSEFLEDFCVVFSIKNLPLAVPTP